MLCYWDLPLLFSWPTVLAFLACLAVGFIRIGGSNWKSGRRPYPPGPPGRLIVGNLADIPKQGYEWLAYAKLAETYGDVIYFNALGKSVLSINSYTAANDLLEKKGAIYSNRPRLPMLKEVLGWSWNLVIQSYSEGFALHRKVVQQKFQPNVVAKSYRTVMTREAKILLLNLHAHPDSFLRHLKRMAGATIMMIAYGHQVTTDEDEYVVLAEKVRGSSTGATGSALVDYMPILKNVPAWFPGAVFKRRAAQPFEEIKSRLADGTAVPSLVGELIENNLSGESVLDEQVIKNVGGVIYSAGADTTVTALTNFFLAMMFYPSAQARAQVELDRVVGSSRLPEFADRPNLPYLSAVVKETLRWRAVAPLGVMHCLTEDDEYRGMYIPKGTVVIPNISAMLHDKTEYADPDDFNPSRFLPNGDCPPAPDPARAAFGFGRRICPGRFFADDQLFITIASILHVFNITRPMSIHGVPLDFKVDWASGIVAVPTPFPCTIRTKPGAELLIPQDTLE
ncbi:hypothetical protein EIP91_007971 [Steccherinum ochraceum]|uniref:Cytochrome P450 n=1 Tax=Steccherinum ochraceum TaxID=92696 RepID=A0A4R0RBR1_9APHY|nr:hypothetical protein EIP91_007971 [Steccherinum ochraceum]